MPPKGSKKAGVKANGAEPAARVDCRVEVKVELAAGESDRVNLAYIEKVQKATECVNAHQFFKQIDKELPLKITDASDSGVQSPFDAAACRKDLQTQSASYTCGVNLFWINLLWSPTPGVPLRCSAIESMSATRFAKPCIMDVLHVAVPDKDYNPLEHKGALLRVSPEEITAAVLLAIARDIEDGVPDAVLKAWRNTVLSTTCTFKVLPDSTARYWYALQQRENISMTHVAVNRSVFQRMHEIHRMIKGMRQLRAASEITAANIAHVYEENIKMTPGAAATVTNKCVDCIVTVINRMVDEPEMSYCLQDLDEKAAVCDDPNPFNSHTRLQALCDKSGKSQQHLTLLVHGIWYDWVKGLSRSLSVTDIRGTASTGNRGLADLLLYKHQVKMSLLQWGRKKLQDDSTDWINGPVTEATSSHKAWYIVETSGDQNYRAGRTGSQTKWLNFMIEVAFGRLYDAP